MFFRKIADVFEVIPTSPILEEAAEVAKGAKNGVISASLCLSEDSLELGGGHLAIGKRCVAPVARSA